MRVDRILRWPELKKRIPLSRSHIYVMMSKGEFPLPINLGPRSVGWVEVEIDEWIQDRLEKRS